MEKGEFSVSVATTCALYTVATKEAVLTWGVLRTGGVLIAGTEYTPPPADELPTRFEAMVGDLAQIDDIYDQAIHLFLTMARCQFFYDVNKRMGRFMMNGHLLQHGYPAINLPAKRQLEFNHLMLAFYSSGEERAMNIFLRSCMDERILRIMHD